MLCQRAGQLLIQRGKAIRRVAAITAEKLVTTVAGEHDLHMLTRKLAEQVKREAGGIAERLVVVIDKRPQGLDQVSVLDL